MISGREKELELLQGVRKSGRCLNLFGKKGSFEARGASVFSEEEQSGGGGDGRSSGVKSAL